MVSMNTMCDDMNKACDRNEEQLKRLQELSSRMPKDPAFWYYLNADLLCTTPDVPSQCSNNPTDKIKPAFVSVVKLSQAPHFTESNAVSEQKLDAVISQDTDFLDRNLNVVFSDSDFPNTVKKFINDKGSEGSTSLSESDAVSFCQYMMKSEIHLSEATGSHLFNLVLYPVICNSENMFVSVLLLEKIRELSNKFPVFMMNGVIIPTVSKEDPEKQKLDIVCDILSGLQEDSLNSVLKGFLMTIKNSESSVKLLSTVMNRKPKLDSEMAFVLISKLQNLSGQYSSSIQFGKMLLEIIPLLNARLSEASLKMLKEVLDHHTTFLKAPALKLFNNISPM